MDKDLILNISNISLYSAFILYLVAVVPFSFSVRSSKKRAEKIGVTLTIVGFVLQIIYFITRWIAAGHAPVSNMYEFLTMFGIMMVGGFLVIYSIYKTPVLALFVLPIAMLLIAYASMFSRDVSPLIPALQSSWLAIHVITVTISYGILSSGNHIYNPYHRHVFSGYDSIGIGSPPLRRSSISENLSVYFPSLQTYRFPQAHITTVPWFPCRRIVVPTYSLRSRDHKSVKQSGPALAARSRNNRIDWFRQPLAYVAISDNIGWQPLPVLASFVSTFV